jgi:lysyl-tRNA synthetase, class II
MSLSEQELVRRDNLRQIQELGINPYPHELVPVSHLSTELKTLYKDEQPELLNKVCIAGRLMALREAGKAVFAEVQDSSGRLQIYVRRDDICPTDDKNLFDKVLKKLTDIGDYISVSGYMFRTKLGEITLHVTSFTFLSKALRPLPIVKKDKEGNVYDAFTNPELRYRQRYVDLTVNENVKKTFLTRNKIIRAMRQFFDDKGWLEVETPILQPLHGGAAAKPFKTHHNALDIPLYLRIANELYLKRLIVGGFDGVYEIGKMFRNEGMSYKHNPEFTNMEIYVAYKDYIWMMGMTEQLLASICQTIHGKTAVEVEGETIEFGGEYVKMSMFESIQKYTGIDLTAKTEEELRQVCRELKISVDNTMGSGKLIDEIFSAKVEKNLIQPTFITDHPLEMTPLAKKHRHKEGLVERFELFVLGKEIANAYTELNDAIDQRERFEQQLELAKRGDDEAMLLDEDFLRAMEYGMPPMSGLGIGLDRFIMLMTNQHSIQEVLFFPQMRPENKQEITE